MNAFYAENINLTILDIGCGKKKRPGLIGVDYTDRHNADVIHDINIFPYPFQSNSINQIYFENAPEYLDKSVQVMEEVHRILTII